MYAVQLSIASLHLLASISLLYRFYCVSVHIAIPLSVSFFYTVCELK